MGRKILWGREAVLCPLSAREVEAAESAVRPSGSGLEHQIKSVSLDVEDLYLLRVVMDLLTQQRDDIQQGWSS